MEARKKTKASTSNAFLTNVKSAKLPYGSIAWEKLLCVEVMHVREIF